MLAYLITRLDYTPPGGEEAGRILRELKANSNGLLFLTTNRVDDIDAAIISRCIALIRYHAPHAADRRKIWGVMTEQFLLAVPEDLLDELVRLFPGATGRDIKGLTKLVAKFCMQKQLPPTREVFIRCSVFRGLELMESE